MQGSGKRGIPYVAAAILLAGVLVSATLILVPLSRSPTTVTATSITTTTQTTTLTSAVTSTETATTTSILALPAGCLPSQSNGYSYETLVAGATSPAMMCVQVYWFSSTSPMVLNTSSLLQIEGFMPGSGNPIPDPAANFTVAASTDQLTLGGPTNAGEGTVLAYSITANAGASGTYWLAVRASELEPGGLRACGPPFGSELFGSLLAGNGQPDYVPPGYLPVCVSGGAPPTFSIPGVNYTVPAGFLCFRIISLMNSTQ